MFVLGLNLPESAGHTISDFILYISNFFPLKAHLLPMPYNLGKTFQYKPA